MTTFPEPSKSAGSSPRQVRLTATRARERAHARGFTLPELMVALVAGLIITMAVVGLARTATNTFYEQVRTTTAEMSLRVASQRLSNDLARAGYMSTGNIRWDPGIARRKEAPNPATDSGSRYALLNNLASLRLYPTGTTDPLLPLEADNGLAPQALDITGNFTSNDQYLGTIGPGSVCGAQRMTLNNDDPAVMRMLLLPDGVTAIPDTEASEIVKSIFMPGARRFAARVSDPSGKTHFVVVCAAAVQGGRAYIEFPSPPAGGNPVLSGSDTGQKGGVEGFEQLQVAPVQVVRWHIKRVANARLDPATDAGTKFDLYRTLVDADGAALNDELIAEYAIDLRFAFTVDQSPNPTTTLSFDFEDQTNNTLWTTPVSTAPTATPGPHRIRSVRFRIATRAALTDRTLDMPGPTGFLYRYCVDGAPAGCKRFARVRTLVSEVAMMNQARMTY